MVSWLVSLDMVYGRQVVFTAHITPKAAVSSNVQNKPKVDDLNLETMKHLEFTPILTTPDLVWRNGRRGSYDAVLTPVFSSQ